MSEFLYINLRKIIQIGFYMFDMFVPLVFFNCLILEHISVVEVSGSGLFSSY